MGQDEQPKMTPQQAAPELLAVLTSLMTYLEGDYDVPAYMRKRAKQLLDSVSWNGG